MRNYKTAYKVTWFDNNQLLSLFSFGPQILYRPGWNVSNYTPNSLLRGIYLFKYQNNAEEFCKKARLFSSPSLGSYLIYFPVRVYNKDFLEELDCRLAAGFENIPSIKAIKIYLDKRSYDKVLRCQIQKYY